MQHVQTGRVAQPEKQENGEECETQFEAKQYLSPASVGWDLSQSLVTILDVRMVFT